MHSLAESNDKTALWGVDWKETVDINGAGTQPKLHFWMNAKGCFPELLPSTDLHSPGAKCFWIALQENGPLFFPSTSPHVRISEKIKTQMGRGGGGRELCQFVSVASRSPCAFSNAKRDKVPRKMLHWEENLPASCPSHTATSITSLFRRFSQCQQNAGERGGGRGVSMGVNQVLIRLCHKYNNPQASLAPIYSVLWQFSSRLLVFPVLPKKQSK